MRRSLVLVLLASLLLAGCTARSSGTKADPFAYTKKALYVGHFELADLKNGTDAQSFSVDDGSIASVRLRAWINATTGGPAQVEVVDSSGRLVWSTTSTGEATAATNLGTWTVRITAPLGSTGSIDVIAARR